MGLGYAPAPGGYAGRDSDKGETRAISQPLLPVLVCSYGYDGSPTSATCIYATLGYEPPGSRRGDGGELQQVLALYLARTITRRSHLNLNARCPTHTKNCDLLNAGAYNSQILCSLFRHTRGVRSKSSRALRLKLQHSHSLVARCYNFSLARSVLTHFNRSRSVTVLHSLDSRVRALKFHSGP